MQRLRRAAFPLVLIAALGAAAVIVVDEPRAELESSVFTSRPDRLRLVVPRNWRASDLPSYPGRLLWMAPPGVPGQIDVTAEQFTRELYCSWPRPCRASKETLPGKYACAMRSKLEGRGLKVGPVQAGPRENEDAGLSSVWFDYDDGRHFLRHAIAFSPDRAFSLVLSAPSNDARAALIRGFEQTLRTLRPLSAEETARAAGIDAAVAGAPGDASLVDSSALVDGAVLDAGVLFESRPAPNISPVGPCDN